MNDIWHFLREFESKDLVKRYIKTKFGYELNSAKAFEITSAFRQGRSYFESSTIADISVKPLLQYYGIVALSRGLILILNRNSRENNITPSHGLKIKNWTDVSKTGKLESIILKTSSGTFKDLINATKNKSYFRAGSSGINWQVSYDVLDDDFEFNLKELSYSYPDLKKSVESWLGYEVPSIEIKSLKHLENKTQIGIQNTKNVGLIFPEELYPNHAIIEATNGSNITYDGYEAPHISQKWESSFQVIGDTYAIPPFEKSIFLNDISKMFATAFIFGTISRYYPTTWNNITTGLKDDSILPFAINFMDFLKEKFPQVIMDFIDSPYEFENKTPAANSRHD